MEQCRVLLVENEPSAYERCLQVVEKHPRLTLGAGVDNFHAAQKLIREKPQMFDLLLTDLQLGDGDGTDLIREWRNSDDTKSRKAMVVSVFGDVTSVIRAVEAGADGYLLKGGADFEIFDSITTVLEGGAPISAAVAGHLLKRVRSERAAVPTKTPTKTESRLSDREVEVLQALARGRSYKEVARDMEISPHTVGGHVKSIYTKLAVTSRGEAVYKAMQEGMIDLAD